MASANNDIDVKGEVQGLEAFRRVEPELLALKDDELIPINLDVAVALQTVFGALPKLKEHRAALQGVGGGFDLARFDKLDDYTRALMYAQGELTGAFEPSNELDALYENASQLRATLQMDLNALANRGLVPKDGLDDLTGSTGFRNVAMDLEALASVLRKTWPSIEGKTPIQKDDIERASQLAMRIVRVAGEREQAQASASAVAQRARAYTLFVRAYDDARRAIIYLRWHEGDADTIAPSLFAGRGSKAKRKPADDAAPTKGPTASVVSTPVATPTSEAAGVSVGGIVIPTGPPTVTGPSKSGPFG